MCGRQRKNNAGRLATTRDDEPEASAPHAPLDKSPSLILPTPGTHCEDIWVLAGVWRN